MAVEGQLKEHTNIKVKQPDLYKDFSGEMCR